MKRAGLALIALGIVACPLRADDKQAYPLATYDAGYYMAPLLANPKPLLQTSFVQGRTGCSSCGQAAAHEGHSMHGGCDSGAGCGRERGDLLHRLVGFFTYRPCRCCGDCGPRVTHYTPPLTSWFRCREGGCYSMECPICGRRHGGHGGCGGCGSCGCAAQLGAPVVPGPTAPGTVVTQKSAPAAQMTQRMSATGQRLYKPTTQTAAAIDATGQRPYSYSQPKTYNYVKPMNSANVQQNGVQPVGGVSQTGAASGYFLPPN